MVHTYYAVYEHAVFSSKSGRAFIDARNESTIFSFLAGTLRNMNCQCVIVGGHQEHVHLLYRRPADLLTKSLVKDLKHKSSAWLKEYGFVDRDFHWQTGYGAFSVSYWDVEDLSAYIKEQMGYHREVSWKDEYQHLLDKHGVNFHERVPLD